jgi:hypothetical protein
VDVKGVFNIIQCIAFMMFFFAFVNLILWFQQIIERVLTVTSPPIGMDCNIGETTMRGDTNDGSTGGDICLTTSFFYIFLQFLVFINAVQLLLVEGRPHVLGIILRMQY